MHALVRWQFRGDIPKTGPLEKVPTAITASGRLSSCGSAPGTPPQAPGVPGGACVDAAFAPPDERIGFRRITLCSTLLPRGPQRHTEFRCLLIRGSYAPL
jgi:hypothetical protein